MSPGTVLADARRRAGLSVSEVSQQTRIRESIIRSIEQDDYSACGGDFYARGHIRAMARAVGTDPVPLIEQYDAVQGPPGPFQEPGAPGTISGEHGESGPAYETGGAYPAPGEPTLPYQPGGFRPLHAGAGLRHHPGAEHLAPRQPMPAYDTGNVRPIPADPGPPEDSDAGPRSFTDQDAAAGLDPSGAWPGPPGGDATTRYTFTDLSAPPDAFTGPGAAPDAFTDPGAALGAGQAHRIFTDPDEEPGSGQGHTFSDSPGLDAVPDSVPGGRFFSEPDTADEAETEWPASDRWSQPAPGEPAAGQQKWDAPAAGQQEWDDPSAGLQEPGEPGAEEEELTGLDALFGRTEGEPPVGAATEPHGYAGDTAGDTAAGTWAAHSAPGGPPTAPPPIAPPPTAPPPRKGTWPGAGRLAGLAALRTADLDRRKLTPVFLVAMLVLIGVLSYVLMSGAGGSPGSRPAAAASSHASPHPSASHHPSPAPTSTPSSHPPATAAVRTLHPVSAIAQGPAGGHGDDPQDASLAIDHRRGTAWHTDWYSTSHFGNLQNGTGLLLNMGRPVTVTSVGLNLGATHGAALQLRAGSSPGHLHTVATAAGAGGGLRLRLSSPAHTRYLLIWFTMLPHDAAGTFEARIYNVTVRGTS